MKPFARLALACTLAATGGGSVASAQTGDLKLAAVTPEMTRFVGEYARAVAGRACRDEVVALVWEMPVNLTAAGYYEELARSLPTESKRRGYTYKLALDERKNVVAVALFDTDDGDMLLVSQFRGSKSLMAGCTL